MVSPTSRLMSFIKDLNCSVCSSSFVMEEYGENPVPPVITDCGHAFHKHCLEVVKKCPECRADIDIAWRARNNNTFMLNAILEELQQFAINSVVAPSQPAAAPTTPQTSFELLAENVLTMHASFQTQAATHYTFEAVIDLSPSIKEVSTHLATLLTNAGYKTELQAEGNALKVSWKEAIEGEALICKQIAERALTDAIDNAILDCIKKKAPTNPESCSKLFYSACYKLPSKLEPHADAIKQALKGLGFTACLLPTEGTRPKIWIDWSDSTSGLAGEWRVLVDSTLQKTIVLNCTKYASDGHYGFSMQLPEGWNSALTNRHQEWLKSQGFDDFIIKDNFFRPFADLKICWQSATAGFAKSCCELAYARGTSGWRSKINEVVEKAARIPFHEMRAYYTFREFDQYTNTRFGAELVEQGFDFTDVNGGHIVDWSKSTTGIAKTFRKRSEEATNSFIDSLLNGSRPSQQPSPYRKIFDLSDVDGIAVNKDLLIQAFLDRGFPSGGRFGWTASHSFEISCYHASGGIAAEKKAQADREAANKLFDYLFKEANVCDKPPYRANRMAAEVSPEAIELVKQRFEMTRYKFTWEERVNGQIYAFCIDYSNSQVKRMQNKGIG